MEKNKCEDFHLGNCLDDAEYVTDPYIEEIYNEIVWRWLCSRCIQERCDDI